MDSEGKFETQRQADFPPTAEFAAVVAAKVQMHLLAGHWAIALRTIEAAEREWREELAEGDRQLALSPEEWLDRSICDFNLLQRTINTLERFGCDTMREALELLTSDRALPQIGPAFREEVFAAARLRKIVVERKYEYKPGGGAGQAKPTAETTAKFNPKFETHYGKE